MTIDEDQLTGFAHRDLVYQGQPIGAIHATFDVSHLFAERREILVTLLVTNGVLALLFSLGRFRAGAEDDRSDAQYSKTTCDLRRTARQRQFPPIKFQRATRRSRACSMATMLWSMQSANVRTLRCSSQRRKNYQVSGASHPAWPMKSTIHLAVSSTPSIP